MVMEEYQYFLKDDYIFDVDGTLTPSRGVMDEEFNQWFEHWMKNKRVFLVTGSSKENTIRQVGEQIYNQCKRVYNCSGNDVYEGNRQVDCNEWELPEEVQGFLLDILSHSSYPHREGWHFDHRIGMCNFSVVGRNADREKRTDYFEWDKEQGEREALCAVLNARYPYLSAKVGGETGVDIFGKDKDKGQILTWHERKNLDHIKFFGDRTDPAGNDFPIAMALRPEQVYAIQDWKHLRGILKNLCVE